MSTKWQRRKLRKQEGQRPLGAGGRPEPEVRCGHCGRLLGIGGRRLVATCKCRQPHHCRGVYQNRICGKKLAEGRGSFTIKCPRCKSVNNFRG